MSWNEYDFSFAICKVDVIAFAKTPEFLEFFPDPSP